MDAALLPKLPLPGAALCTEITDLLPAPFGTFPAERAALSPVTMLLLPASPFILVIAYLLSEPLLKLIVKHSGFLTSGQPKKAWFKAAVAAHNLLLTVFSAAVMVGSIQVIWSHAAEVGWFPGVYCDADGSLWDKGFGFYATVFYISKYCA